MAMCERMVMKCLSAQYLSNDGSLRICLHSHFSIVLLAILAVLIPDPGPARCEAQSQI